MHYIILDSIPCIQEYFFLLWWASWVSKIHFRMYRIRTLDRCLSMVCAAGQCEPGHQVDGPGGRE